MTGKAHPRVFQRRLVKHARSDWLLLAESHLTKWSLWQCARADRRAVASGRDSRGCGSREVDPESKKGQWGV
jgi:hypothetical protein